MSQKRLNIFKVDGNSMSSTLLHDDYVLCYWKNGLDFREGDVVVVNHDVLDTIVKRVEKIEDGYFLMSGDNPLSSSTQTLGWQSTSNILGKAIWRFSHACSSIFGSRIR